MASPRDTFLTCVSHVRVTYQQYMVEDTAFTAVLRVRGGRARLRRVSTVSNSTSKVSSTETRLRLAMVSARPRSAQYKTSHQQTTFSNSLDLVIGGIFVSIY
ncbi:uncharacterized protein LOC124356258 isoform X2 [Homalodisca vitripennis]|uniref:uncharacterized protein LOC124356258 isoform X1 n=1 Tax=Homalodisca vitripennis TaxID=197043 RepID=UPI001EEA35F6|nr:uncharacterized protein LOC124356258 isoform X1 [Homalodisca vitripennis]XP_046663400.1 uncharacterized protein LOC124356258 isoform X2 [Homalodisca vitripennis]